MERQLGHLSYLFMAILFIWSIYDSIENIQQHASYLHVATELSIQLMALFWIAYNFKKFFEEHRQNAKMKKFINEQSEEIKKLKFGIGQHLGQYIEKQFVVWNLTPKEKEVFFLLLKGISTKEMAEVQQCAEKTIRIHISNILKKTQLNNRQELMAYFMEDLMSDTLGGAPASAVN